MYVCENPILFEVLGKLKIELSNLNELVVHQNVLSGRSLPGGTALDSGATGGSG